MPTWGLMVWLAGSYWLHDTPTHKRKSFLLSLILSGISATLLTLLLYSPILLSSGWNALSGNAFVESAGWPQFLGKLPSFLAEVWATWVRDFPPPASLLIAAGVLLSLITHKHLARYKVWPALPLVIGCGLVLFVQHAIPFTRVWLFLQPFVFILAAAGWIGLFCRVLIKTQSDNRMYFTILVLLLMGALAFPVTQSPAIYLERETGSLPQADQVADYLISHTGEGDVVLGNRPAYLIPGLLFPTGWHRYSLAAILAAGADRKQRIPGGERTLRGKHQYGDQYHRPGWPNRGKSTGAGKRIRRRTNL